MHFLKLDPRFRRKPKARKAGWAAREVYLLLCQLSGDYDLRGVIPRSMLDAEWLAEEWGLDETEPTLRCSPSEFILWGLNEAATGGLLEHTEDGVRICGWEDMYSPAKTPAERKQAERDRKRGEEVSRESRLSRTSVTVTDVTNVTLLDKTRLDETKTTLSAFAADVARSGPLAEGAAAVQPLLVAVPSAQPSPARQVFEHWKRVMGKNGNATFEGKRERNVRARLSNFTAEQLCQAIDGCALTPHNMGVNERNERYDDLELICRDAVNVERFISNAKKPPSQPKPTRDVPRHKQGGNHV